MLDDLHSSHSHLVEIAYCGNVVPKSERRLVIRPPKRSVLQRQSGTARSLLFKVGSQSVG